MDMLKPIMQVEKPEFIYVDDWIPEESDKYFRNVKRAIYLPVAQFYGFVDNDHQVLNYFDVSTKKSYNSDKLKDHLCLYLNYFLKFYDTNKELLANYYKIKYMIDYVAEYNRDAFEYDIKKYILDGSNLYRVWLMVRDNYHLNLNANESSNANLKYNDDHGKIFMEISILMNMIIPLATHFIFVRKIRNVKDFLLNYIDIIISKYNDEVDIYNKLYETASSNVERSANAHPVLWQMQGIRAKNTTTHAMDIVNNILLQIMPKYVFNQNMILFNYTSISTNIKYQVTDIGYEYSFIGLSSSKRDADGNNSEFDKFENHLTKTDESLYLMNKVACETTMKTIERQFGPFSDNEIAFYRRELTNDGGQIINQFQMGLIFNLFYKFFGDTSAIKAINSDDYIKLMIAGKRMLEANKMVMLPYILSARINRLASRKNVNKRELQRLMSSPSYASIQAKYKNEKIEKYIINIIAVIISSEFVIIDYDEPELNGKTIDILGDMLIEDLVLYINLI